MFPYKNNFCRGTFFMADFNSNFNDIQKQIAVADLTDEQIQALVTALQIKRNFVFWNETNRPKYGSVPNSV